MLFAVYCMPELRLWGLLWKSLVHCKIGLKLRSYSCSSEWPGRLFTTGAEVVEGQWRLLATEAAVLKEPVLLLTTKASVCEGQWQSIPTGAAILPNLNDNTKVSGEQR